MSMLTRADAMEQPLWARVCIKALCTVDALSRSRGMHRMRAQS